MLQLAPSKLGNASACDRAPDASRGAVHGRGGAPTLETSGRHAYGLDPSNSAVPRFGATHERLASLAARQEDLSCAHDNRSTCQALIWGLKARFAERPRRMAATGHWHRVRVNGVRFDRGGEHGLDDL